MDDTFIYSIGGQDPNLVDIDHSGQPYRLLAPDERYEITKDSWTGVPKYTGY